MFKKDIKVLNGTNLSYCTIGTLIDEILQNNKKEYLNKYFINNQKYVIIYEEMITLDKFTIVYGDYYE